MKLHIVGIHIQLQDLKKYYPADSHKSIMLGGTVSNYEQSQFTWQNLEPKDREQGDRVVVVSWSAGSGLMRKLSATGSPPLWLDGYVAADSIYGPKDLSPSVMGRWNNLFNSHVKIGVVWSLVRTYEYANTQETAKWLMIAYPDRAQYFNQPQRKNDRATHIAAMREAGPMVLQTLFPRPQDRSVDPTSNRSDIRTVQQAVGTTPDGRWGPKTSRAVKNFQMSTGLKLQNVWDSSCQKFYDSCAWGVDVSHHNTVHSWGDVKAGGYTFAIVRTAYGVKEDRKFFAHINGARDAGLIVAAYLFVRPSIEKQAEPTLSMLHAAGIRSIFLDLEQDPATPKLAHTCAAVARLADAFRDFRVGYYGAAWWPHGWPKSPTRIWIAGQGHTLPAHVKTYDIRQVDAGVVPGVLGPCDRNIFMGALTWF